MDPRVVPLAMILQLNTRLFRNCLDGLTEEQASLRPSDTTNSAVFVAAHLADSRFFLLCALGAERPTPLARYLDGRRSIDEVDQNPPLDVIATAWGVLTFLVQHDGYHVGQLALLRKYAGLPAMKYA